MTGANIARAMQLSPPTVHEMIGRLERDGYVTREPDKSLRFTDDGREHAQAIVRRHRLIERFLTDVLGIPWDEVHEEAERLEHAMSPVLEERMLAAIGDAKTCPHGHPIVEGAREHGRRCSPTVELGAKVARPALRERGRGAAALPASDAGPATRASTASSRAPTTTRSWSPPPTASTRSRAASPRRSRCAPTRRPRRAPPLPEAARALQRPLRPLSRALRDLAASSSCVDAADLAQAEVERLVLRAHAGARAGGRSPRGRGPRGQRGEAPLGMLRSLTGRASGVLRSSGPDSLEEAHSAFVSPRVLVRAPQLVEPGEQQP